MLLAIEYINVSDNEFSGEVSPEWIDIKNLTQLELSNNIHLFGGVPRGLTGLVRVARNTNMHQSCLWTESSASIVHMLIGICVPQLLLQFPLCGEVCVMVSVLN